MEEVKEKEKLPEGWRRVRLGEICKITTGRKDVNEGNPEGQYVFFTCSRTLTKSDSYSFDTEALLVAGNGEVGTIHYYKGKFEAYQRTYVLYGFGDYNVKHIYYYLLKNLIKSLEKDRVGTTIQYIRCHNLNELVVLVPHLREEQRKIAEILETIDNVIEKTDQIIEKYKRIKQGLMQELFTKGITAFEFEKDKLITAVEKAFKNGDYNFGREENLISHLSDYLREVFSEWDVDSEVEKNEERQRPDIIIHKRNTNENLFAIEVKKSEDLNRIKEDIKKLEDLMLKEYHYEDAVFIGFNIENFDRIFKLSEKVNFILISKAGEIKIKKRVRRFKNSPLGRIPEEWEVVRLGDIFNIFAGGDIDKLNFSHDKSNIFKYPIYSNTLENKGLYGYADSYKFPENSITITARGVLGVAIPRFEKFNAIIRLLVLIPKEKVNITFVSEYINTFVNFYAEETGVPQLTAPRASVRLILLSPLPEQQRIASILSQIDEVIEKEQNYKQKLKRIKQGLMEDLLTGKVRVNCLIEEV